MKYIIAGANWEKRLSIYKIEDDNMLKEWLDHFPPNTLNYEDDEII